MFSRSTGRYAGMLVGHTLLTRLYADPATGYKLRALG